MERSALCMSPHCFGTLPQNFLRRWDKKTTEFVQANQPNLNTIEEWVGLGNVIKILLHMGSGFRGKVVVDLLRQT